MKHVRVLHNGLARKGILEGSVDSGMIMLENGIKISAAEIERAVRRQNPRQEPCALVALARVRAGGAEQSASLPRPEDFDDS